MVKWIRGAAGMVFLAAFLWGCSPGQADEQTAEEQKQAVAGLEGRDVQRVTQTASPEPEGTGIAVNPSGAVLSERIPVPSGFQRTDAGEGSFQDYIRSYPLKPDRSPVMLYDGSEKGNQTAHAAVFALPVFDSDLQQCADSLMRMYGEYLWAHGAGDEIAFHLTNGFLMDYASWREGNRLSVDGNQVSWVKKASYDDSYETFLLYMKYVMMYAGTLSLDNECTVIDISRIKAGDMFIKGGSPGHCVMVA
uniref:DUF4846 domain-containing protein n=2 Tax=Lachnospiraceae TaxID=186803 RepID=UPI002A815B2E